MLDEDVFENDLKQKSHRNETDFDDNNEQDVRILDDE